VIQVLATNCRQQKRKELDNDRTRPGRLQRYITKVSCTSGIESQKNWDEGTFLTAAG